MTPDNINDDKKNVNYQTYKGQGIHFILAAFIVIWLCTPSITQLPVFRSWLLFAVFFLWFLSGLMSNRMYIKRLIPGIIFLLLWISVLFLNYLIGRGSNPIQTIYNQFYLLIAFSIYIYYLMINNRTYCKSLVFIVLLSFVVTSIITIIEINKDPLVSKLLGTAEGISYSTFAGGYTFIYALVAVIPCLLLMCKKTKGKLKIFLLLLSGLFIYTVYVSSYVTAIVLMIGLIILLILPGKKLLNYFWVSSLIILVIFNRQTLGYVLNSFAHNINNQLFTERFVDISYIFIGNNLGEVSSLGNRMKDFVLSAVTFMNNPLLGSGAYYGNDNFLYGIGGHSQWIDDLARYGIIGVIPFWTFFIGQFRNIYSRLKKMSYEKIYGILIVYIIVLGFLDPVFGPGICAVIFIFLPFLPCIINYELENCEVYHE